MAALAASLIVTYGRGAKPNNMTLASAGFVFVFGGLTLFLQDETFIKIKPSLVYVLFAAILGFGLVRGHSYLQILMSEALKMQPAGWLVLTRRWIFFFLFLAALNEFIWRNFSTDAWVNFKVFGILPLTFIFMAAQMPLLKRHGALDEIKRLKRGGNVQIQPMRMARAEYHFFAFGPFRRSISDRKAAQSCPIRGHPFSARPKAHRGARLPPLAQRRFQWRNAATREIRPNNGMIKHGRLAAWPLHNLRRHPTGGIGAVNLRRRFIGNSQRRQKPRAAGRAYRPKPSFAISRVHLHRQY